MKLFSLILYRTRIYRFPATILFFRTPDENDESRFHCIFITTGGRCCYTLCFIYIWVSRNSGYKEFVEANRCFRGTCRLYLQGLKVSQTMTTAASCWFLAWLTFQPWKWRRHVPPKCRLTFTGLHDDMFHEIQFFMCFTCSSLSFLHFPSFPSSYLPLLFILLPFSLSSQNWSLQLTIVLLHSFQNAFFTHQCTAATIWKDYNLSLLS
jgi:hypothetical protein